MCKQFYPMIDTISNAADTWRFEKNLYQRALSFLTFDDMVILDHPLE
ncbi:MAG: hypothetical protein KKH41_08135 [Candidatus Thermoplasmatota archaeon]|nr:hypothetical protein [Candidatus Thermoplasmatota archaeon]MBU4072085.1 hypothetical protein [Candidatus Thermoplasmatota archaeon]MBU4143928.1 hypothetical protein [Candidatus Thermoplasmatota archaeon]MBU4592535.1 hypothetical protein [Candidatus Thermoplasmatota archaeon]